MNRVALVAMFALTALGCAASANQLPYDMRVALLDNEDNTQSAKSLLALRQKQETEAEAHLDALPTDEGNALESAKAELMAARKRVDAAQVAVECAEIDEVWQRRQTFERYKLESGISVERDEVDACLDRLAKARDELRLVEQDADALAAQKRRADQKLARGASAYYP
jgi:hypothetical protein